MCPLQPRAQTKVRQLHMTLETLNTLLKPLHIVELKTILSYSQINDSSAGSQVSHAITWHIMDIIKYVACMGGLKDTGTAIAECRCQEVIYMVYNGIWVGGACQVAFKCLLSYLFVQKHLLLTLAGEANPTQPIYISVNNTEI